MALEIQEPNTAKQSLFDWLGGAEKGAETIRNLVETFYDTMDSDPKAAGLRAIHQADLTEAREKLFMFLMGWTGGPQLYRALWAPAFTCEAHAVPHR